MRRLGLVWRVTLIVIAALVAIQMIAAAAYYVQRGRATEQGFRLPLPDQMAALARTDIPAVDITGGAPELNPNFRWLAEVYPASRRFPPCRWPRSSCSSTSRSS